MIEKMQFYNTLAFVFMAAGIMFALIAIFIFVKSGIKDFYKLTHFNSSKMHSGNTGNLKQKKRLYQEENPEEHSVKSPSEVLNENKKEEREKEKVPVKTSAHHEVPPAASEALSTPVEDEYGAEKTEDLLKKDFYDAEDEDGCALTEILEDDAPTGILDQGFGPTELLDKNTVIPVKKEQEENKQLWAGGLDDVTMTDLHNILIIHTKKQVK